MKTEALVAHQTEMKNLRDQFIKAGIKHPFLKEADRIEFKHKGYDCLLSRNPNFGNWCGYAAVPPGHPLHGKSSEDTELSAHGGITFAEGCGGFICHVPAEGEPDNVWWFGFDCAHAGDEIPYMALADLAIGGLQMPHKFTPHYWTTEEVIEETKKLAEQLANEN